MGTNCHIHVVQEGLDWEEKVTLYRHYDAIPSNIINLIKDCYEKHGDENEGGRSGKVASFLCAFDPGEMEPQDNHNIQKDISYYYILRLVNHIEKGRWKKNEWIVELYHPNENFYHVETPTINELELLRSGSIESISDDDIVYPD